MSFFKPFRPLLVGWLLSLLAWGLIGLALAAQAIISADEPWRFHLAMAARDWLPWILVTPLLFRLASRFPLDGQRWWKSLPVHLACCAGVTTAIYWWESKGSLDLFGDHLAPPHHARPASPHHGRPPPPPHAVDRGPGGAGRHHRPPHPPPRDGSHPPGRPRPSGPGHGHKHGVVHLFTWEFPIYLALVAGGHALHFYRKSERQAARLTSARLDALRMQLQPHFLFNSLNMIASLIHEDPEKADQLLGKLGELLRASLNTTGNKEITLGEEVDFARSYLELMQARFEERLRFEIAVPDGFRSIPVPPMLLQPLIENAVEHGLAKADGGGTVHVRAGRESNALVIEVSDDGPGIDTAQFHEGVGIHTTRARLHDLYGDAGSLEIGGVAGTTATLRIPFNETGQQPTPAPGDVT